MKTPAKELFFLYALTAGLGLMLAGRTTAQTFTVLHSFAPSSIDSTGVYTNNEGINPQAELSLSGNTLYGTTAHGGISGYGTVFALDTDGTGFTNLLNFTVTNSSGTGPSTEPNAAVAVSHNTLYGTTYGGGTFGYGTVFALHTDGTGFTNLYGFTRNIFGINSDGEYPRTKLAVSGNTLYGTAWKAGASGNGTVFRVNIDGTSFTNLHNFSTSSNYPPQNGDGANPLAGLILSGNALYGTAYFGGTFGWGTVFRVNTDGSGFTNLHSFNYTSDGAEPQSRLILSGNVLYGTAESGGIGGVGTVFRVNIDGTGFTNLHSFTAVSAPYYTNSDGGNPYAGLVLCDNTLYGTASQRGSSGDGTVFAVNTDGSGFTNLHTFSGTNDGVAPFGDVILSGNTLYGTTDGGGSSGQGTVFSLSLPLPQLAILPSVENVILTWPTNGAGINYAGFSLQSTTNLGPAAVWTTNSPPPVVVNGQYTVTNPLSGTQMFYRLIH